MNRRRLHEFPWGWLLLSASAFAVSPSYEAVTGQPRGQVIGVGIVALVVAVWAWGSLVVEITDDHVRKYLRRHKLRTELPRDRIAGAERSGGLLRLYTHDGAEMWFGPGWPAKSKRLLRLLGLPEPVKLTTGESRAVIRDWLDVVVMSVLITVLGGTGVVVTLVRGQWRPGLSYLVGACAALIVVLVVWEIFNGVVVGEEGVRMARSRVVVRRDTIREVVNAGDKRYVRDDGGRWFELGQGDDAANRLAAVLDVPFRRADRVEGRLIG